jgi:hypothetical protein
MDAARFTISVLEGSVLRLLFATELLAQITESAGSGLRSLKRKPVYG